MQTQLQTQVKNIMTKNVITVNQETEILEIADILFKNNLTGVPVVENNKVVGIITEEDLLAEDKRIHIPSYIKFLETVSSQSPDKKHLEKEREKIIHISAKDIMNVSVITINPEADLKKLARLFNEKRVNPVPVVKSGSGELVGIISRADLIKFLWKDK